ncbi:Piso0_005852 [Millerozyma farinosa CBS 7064]|uniref:Protein BIG1 n=1 Tax=Pichia sorbitophila (strain ATCC MYA-4447 / BCRC 22081 / CBS 7064 / NBRC 10061 / NRRL Y-12695) TaxID=559304 RepID=G8Y335_PICSO|nr:Piso0_005852 [Millerozyma farinosa CBS 7064]
MLHSMLSWFIALLPLAYAFTDTAPFYSSQKLTNSFPYIASSKAVGFDISSIVNNICESNDRIVIYRVKNLQREGIPQKGTFLKHVQYANAGDLDITKDISCSASQVKHLFNEQLGENDNTNVVIIDIEDQAQHKIDEFLGDQSDKIVVVQGKPSFGTNDHQNEAVLESIQGGLRNVYASLEKNVLKSAGNGRRSADAEDEDSQGADDFDKVVSEVESDFDKAKSMLAQESDLPVNILTSESESSPSITSVPSVSAKHDLFSKYQFFSPGIWMCSIVSIFLVFVLSVALSWITSLEISYKAFEKPIDFEKKTE